MQYKMWIMDDMFGLLNITVPFPLLHTYIFKHSKIVFEFYEYLILEVISKSSFITTMPFMYLVGLVM